jgi:lycopene beta-cyclase
MAADRFDFIFLGGGLAGGLCALALATRRPDLKLLVVEAGATLGGNHLWSFFDSDIAIADRWLVEPLIVHRWPGYEVRFPAYTRKFDEPYQSIESERFDAVVRAALPGGAVVQGQVEGVDGTTVTLADGRSFDGGRIVDTRGAGDLSKIGCGWQKFVGQTLKLSKPHGLARPVIMDASVEQLDGYRFVYLLPFSEHEVFVEDTYYSDTPDLDVEQIERRIADYARQMNWEFEPSERQETGVLPVVTGGAFENYWPASDSLDRGGVRAGLFQPLTSYSLPDAVRFASGLAADPTLDIREYAADHWRRGRFNRLLTRMLFRAAKPAERYRVLQRFYSLPESLIARFYAGRSTLGDKARVLIGKPPIPIGRAVRAILEDQ